MGKKPVDYDGGRKLSSLELTQRLSRGGGWVADRPILSDAEIAELAAMIRPSLNAAGRKQFGIYVQNIFANAVAGLNAHERLGGAPAVAMRKRLAKFLSELERARAAINHLDGDLCALLDANLAALALKQRVNRIECGVSIERWRRATSERLGLLIHAAKQTEISPVKGESGTVWRQMVKGLLALVHALTSEVPRRNARRRSVGDATTLVEDYWLLDLSQRLAGWVLHAARAEMRALESMHGENGAEEVARGPKREPASKTHAAGHRGARPKAARVAKPRKRVGPPSLAMIVRQELQALKAELSDAPTGSDAG